MTCFLLGVKPTGNTPVGPLLQVVDLKLITLVEHTVGQHVVVWETAALP